MKTTKLTGLIIFLFVLHGHTALAAGGDTASRHARDYKNQVSLDIAPILGRLMGQSGNSGLNLFYLRRITDNPVHPLFFRIGVGTASGNNQGNYFSRQLSIASESWNQTNEAEAGLLMQFGKRKLKWYVGADAGVGRSIMHDSSYVGDGDSSNSTAVMAFTTRFISREQVTSNYIFVRPAIGAFVNLSRRFTLGTEFNFRLSYGNDRATGYVYDKLHGINQASSANGTALLFDINALFSRVFLSYRF
jgi:hypothetical protein